MPFRSKKQAKWMFANRPRLAKKWAKHTSSLKTLPETVVDNWISNYSYSSTQLNITDSLVLQRIKFLQDKLDPEDVVELETQPHITVKYGLLREVTSKTVADVVKNWGPLWVTLGNLSVFPATVNNVFCPADPNRENTQNSFLFNSGEYDVLKLEVKSLGLENLHRHLSGLPNEDRHNIYSPHLTIAYLKPGTGYKYTTDPSMLEWIDFVFTKLTFSTKEGKQSEIALNVFCATGKGGGTDPTCKLSDIKNLKDLKAGLREVPFKVNHDSPFYSLFDDIQEHIEKTARKQPLTEIKLASVEATQQIVTEDSLEKILKTGKGTGSKGNPVVVRINGKNLLLDGTHRATLLKLSGQTTIQAHYLDIGKIPTDHTKRINWQRKYEKQINNSLSLNNSFSVSIDPTRTTTLRKKFAIEMTKRFEKLKRDIIRVIVEEDAFGLKSPNRGKLGNVFNVFCPTGEGGGVDPTCKLSGRVSEEQKKSLKLYRGGSFSPINKALRTGKKPSPAIQQRIKDIDLAIESQPVLPEGEILHRFDSWNGWDQLARGEVSSVSLPSYVSTSKEARYSTLSPTDQSHKIEIVLGPGVKGYEYPNEGRHKNEKEILLQRGLKATLISKEHTNTLGFHQIKIRLDVDHVNNESRGLLNNLLQNTRWKFNTSSEQVEAFKKWLQTKVVKYIISEAHRTDDDWWTAYIEEGFRKGAGRAFDDVRKKATVPQEKLSWYNGTKDQFLRDSFARPESIDKVKLLAGRVFTDLEGVTQAMSTNIARTLTDGLVQGKNPRDIARDLNENVDKIGKKRAVLIARTEIIRAHAEGQLVAMENLGVEGVTAAVEWSTAGDHRVCDLCKPLNGVVLTLKEAHGILPRHPQCRCAWLPANLLIADGQLRSQSKINLAIDKSLRAELPKTKSAAQRKKKSSWAGAGKTIETKRPQALLTNRQFLKHIGNIFYPTNGVDE